MAEHALDIATFRLLFPAFADEAAFTDVYLQAQWGLATTYINPWDNSFVRPESLQQALNLLTAHLVQVNVLLAAGGPTASVGVLQSAGIDKVTVTNAAPITRSGWQYWLATTPYGLQLWALLRLLAGPGDYVGGLPERAAYRKVGGLF